MNILIRKTFHCICYLFAGGTPSTWAQGRALLQNSSKSGRSGSTISIGPTKYPSLVLYSHCERNGHIHQELFVTQHTIIVDLRKRHSVVIHDIYIGIALVSLNQTPTIWINIQSVCNQVLVKWIGFRRHCLKLIYVVVRI